MMNWEKWVQSKDEQYLLNVSPVGADEFNRFAIFRFQSIVLILEFNWFTAFSTSIDLDLNRFIFDL